MKGFDPGLATVFLILPCLLGCVTAGKSGGGGEIFGKTPEGGDVMIFTLINAAGAKARITNYGATLVSLEVPDGKGQITDVVLGYDRLSDYLAGDAYFGCVVGRYGNRIGKAGFSLGGKEFRLAANDGTNHLHGGIKGFDKVVWKARRNDTPEGQSLVLRYLSKDGEEGYPGNLECELTYTLKDDNSFCIDYRASTDRETIVNLTHHSYFNLKGAGEGDILGHELMINADRFTPIDEESIPTGELASVKGTPFDFTQFMEVGARIDGEDEQLRNGKGYDHNWVLRGQKGELELAAVLREKSSGRVMEVLTTEPGVQFYSGNFLDGSDTGKGGVIYKKRYGLCLETQHYPDSPNKADFPSVILKPGQAYSTRTIYRFKTK